MLCNVALGFVVGFVAVQLLARHRSAVVRWLRSPVGSRRRVHEPPRSVRGVQLAQVTFYTGGVGIDIDDGLDPVTLVKGLRALADTIEQAADDL